MSDLTRESDMQMQTENKSDLLDDEIPEDSLCVLLLYFQQYTFLSSI